jgi:hypothetical protein
MSSIVAISYPGSKFYREGNLTQSFVHADQDFAQFSRRVKYYEALCEYLVERMQE